MTARELSTDTVISPTGVPFHRVVTPKFTHYLMDSPSSGTFGVAVRDHTGGFLVYCPVLEDHLDAAAVATRLALDDNEASFVYTPAELRTNPRLRLKSILNMIGVTMPGPELALTICQAVSILSESDEDPAKNWDQFSVELRHTFRIGGEEDIVEFFSSVMPEPLLALATLIAADSNQYLPVGFIADIIDTRRRNGTLDLERTHLENRGSRNPNSSSFVAFSADAAFICWPDVLTFGPAYEIDANEHVWWASLRKNIADLNVMLTAINAPAVDEPTWNHDPRHLHVNTTGNDTADRALLNWARVEQVPVVFDHHEPNGDDSALVTVDDLDAAQSIARQVRSGELACHCSAGLFTGDLSVLAAFDTAAARLRHASFIPRNWRYEPVNANLSLRKMDNNAYVNMRFQAHTWRESTALPEARFALTTVTEGVLDYILPQAGAYAGERQEFMTGNRTRGSFLERFIETSYQSDPSVLVYYRRTGELPQTVYGAGTDDLVRLAEVITATVTAAANGDDEAAYRLFHQNLSDVLTMEMMKQDDSKVGRWAPNLSMLEIPRWHHLTTVAETYLAKPESLDVPFSWWARLSGLTSMA